MTRRSGGGRRGFGSSLVTVMGVILVLLAFGLALSEQSRSLTGQVQRAVLDQQCDALARLVLEEAMHRVRTRSQRPGDPLFTLMRETQAPLSLALPLAELPQAARELAAEPRLRLDGDVVLTLVKRAMTAREDEEQIGAEAFGMVRLVARVTGPGGAAARRQDDWAFRSVVTAPPRPFDTPSFFLGDPTALLGPGHYEGDANAAITMALARIEKSRLALRQLFEMFEKAAAEIRRELSKARKLKKVPAAVTRALALLDALAAYLRATEARPVWPARDWRAVETSGLDPDPEDRLHLFARPLAVYSFDPGIELGRFDLPGRVGALTAELVAEEPELVRLELAARDALVAPALDAGRIDGAIRAFVPRLVRHVGQLDALLRTYKDFQDGLVEASGPAYEDLTRRMRRLSWENQLAKAQHVFRGEGAAAAAAAFLARRPNPTGVVAVADPVETLVLDLDGIQGRLVVTVAGDLRVARATVADPAKDALVLVGYKGFEIEGPCTAARVALGEGGYRGDGRDFSGSLVLATMLPGAPRDLILKGILSWQESLLSGPDGEARRPPPAPGAVHVAFGPAPTGRVVGR